MLPKLSFAALLFWSTALSAQTPAADTTIAGQTLPLLPIETLIAQLQRPANGPAVVHRQVAFRGRLFAPTSGLDTLRVPLDLEEVYFLDEVSFSQVAFLAPVRLERTHFAGGLSFAEAHFTDDFSLHASHLAKHATFQKTHFLGDADLSASHFAGVTSFVGAHFAGQRTHFAQTQFDNAAYFEQAAFVAPATFTDAAFAGIASFKETTWSQPLSFAGVRFADQALFWDAHFAEEVSFDSGRADGEVAFDRARFSGEASFADFTFARAAHFRSATFGQAHFDGAYFRQEADFSDSEGRVIRLSAFFNRSLDLSRATFALIDLRSAGSGFDLRCEQPPLPAPAALRPHPSALAPASRPSRHSRLDPRRRPRPNLRRPVPPIPSPRLERRRRSLPRRAHGPPMPRTCLEPTSTLGSRTMATKCELRHGPPANNRLHARHHPPLRLGVPHRFQFHALRLQRSPAHPRRLHHLQPLHLHPPQLPRLRRDGQAQTPRCRRSLARLGLLRPAHRRSFDPRAVIWPLLPYCWRSATALRSCLKTHLGSR